ncbi:branched-chain-amino-acid transaminase [Halanaerobium congolense]|uniref:Branched-chain-amino-acid aminotransferase n=1 Tax=Halanaerobium congolense TaxID=54121 RepID=A0A1G6HZ91_9FIRM|nr:branched-chain-amino-acid transaminase [Halanaerobium congolense]KXS50501.1 MAG: Branched-chain amino acid aminotransferase [Halanaerobium sp. T82-1]PUU90936.1 MAG: branched-chain amino acid aminotransferase [Halanaerobium sp.]PTX17008.1 branched-chain amino acid aminotransferase [Halanaerobium congolense]PXV65955.1 branched-chain amino acid aminotransferase [Halanaerobium congolense]TDP27072.1 branched-chain amino acid aminotransferase [Halanaerobium congolense]
MSRNIYLNGEIVPEAQAKISVFDHGFLYGDGIFEGIRAYNGRVFMLDQHIKRLYQSAKTIMLDIPLTKKEMEAAILKTIRANELSDAYIRVVVSRGEGDLGLDPRKCSEPTVVIIASAIQLYPEELYKTGLKLVTVPTRRNGPEMVNPRIKSLNYLNNIMARIEANQQGAPEAIILNTDGYVAECTGDNIFIIEEDTITTPPRYAGILKGTKREIVLAAAAEMGLEVKEELFTRHDLFNADECFLSGTAAEAIPVVEVDGRVIADGSVGEKTKAIIARFREIAQTTGTEIYND